MCERGDIQVLKLPRSDGSLEPVGVDSCIEPIVRALNDAGLRTVASCCGHGIRPGTVALADGREVLILPDFETARSVDPLWPPLALPALRSAPTGEGEAWINARCNACERSIGGCTRDARCGDRQDCALLGLERLRAAPVPAREGEEGSLLELAWGLIANVSDGNWQVQSDDWCAAAERWRDRWLALPAAVSAREMALALIRLHKLYQLAARHTGAEPTPQWLKDALAGAARLRGEGGGE